MYMMSKKRLFMVTGNAGKLREVSQILEKKLPDLELVAANVDLPELQGEPDEISRGKVKAALPFVDGPFILEDTSLCFDALGGLPGPYIKWFLKKLKCDGLLKMLAGFDNYGGSAVCCFAFCRGKGHEPILFNGVVKGTIVPPRGEKGFGWDPIFQPEGYSETYAEMSDALKNQISHRKLAVELLSEYLSSHEEVLDSVPEVKSGN
eukprot:TRINITY_DN975_c0_g1_i1.p1 TRINITY_DN975_c0_g1~~TRINITY_DN975_c0_g1_i1.p1  ORF type:complete len:206 (+),score=52.83 TRINITY_DN975_c0_g1_i1:541-1158(+)